MMKRQSDIVTAMPPSEIRKIFNAANQMTDVMHLEIGDPDFATPPHVIEAAHRAARDGFTHYTGTSGIPEVREAIAEKFQRDNGIVADPGNCMMTVGAVGALLCACMATLNPGDEVIVTDPYWSNYSGQIAIAGGKIVSVPLRESLGFAPDLEELESKITPRTRMILYNTPNNPSGSVLPKDVLMGIGEIALKHDLIVLADEVYEKIIYDGNTHFSLASIPEYRDHVITVNSCSKTYAMTGWRAGLATGPAELIAGMTKVQEANSSCVSAVVQKAALAALTGPQDCVKEMVEVYTRRRDMILQRLAEIPGLATVRPGGAFYVFPNVQAYGMSSFDFTMRLLREARVALVHGAGFGKYGEGHVRISFSVADEVIAEALRRLAAFVEG
jgi:aminotransferase